MYNNGTWYLREREYQTLFSDIRLPESGNAWVYIMLRRVILPLLILSLLMFCFTPSSLAFDANDYDSSWDSGWDSDWNSGWDSDWDSDWSGSYDDISWSDFDTIERIVVIIIITFLVSSFFVVPILVVLGKLGIIKNGKGVPAAFKARPVVPDLTLPNRTAQIEQIVKEGDPNFSANDFLSFTKRVYVDIQLAWCKRDLNPVRVFLHDNLFDTTVKQIREKITQGVLYHYEILWSIPLTSLLTCVIPNMSTSSFTSMCACSTVVTTGRYSWVLSDFGTVRSDTVDEGIS